MYDPIFVIKILESTINSHMIIDKQNRDKAEENNEIYCDMFGDGYVFGLQVAHDLFCKELKHYVECGIQLYDEEFDKLY